MTPPETRYARSGDLRIAYQVVGNGPFDLVFVSGFASNAEVFWEMPEWAHLFSRLAGFSRLILFDKRGTGLSDRMAGITHLEERMDDVRAVMDAAGSQRAALFGISEGGPMSLLFAATYPERVRALALYGSYAHHPTLSDGNIELHAKLIDQLWGTGEYTARFRP
jgi:pimeloyl-ACP methyl ester carboxylesterase